MLRGASAVAVAAGLAWACSAQVIVTEVFYNPGGAEPETEWLEVYNAGTTPVDITNYRFDDEDPNTPSHPFGSGAVRLPDGTILPESSDPNCLLDIINCTASNQIVIDPGEAIVIGVFADTRNLAGAGGQTNGFANSLQSFVASWGDDTDGDGVGDRLDYRVVLLITNITIANTASLTNEVLDLLDGNLRSVDFVNYQSGAADNDWPFSANGRSLVLQPNFLSFSDEDRSRGVAWSLAADGVDGGYVGRQVQVPNAAGTLVTLYAEGDVASPGAVGDLFASFVDANNNGRDDALDIFLGVSQDCDRNRVPDDAQSDCDNNGVPDACELFLIDVDCDGDGQPDNCQITNNPSLDTNNNGLIDSCESFRSIVISEIMFDAAGATEADYVELYNAGSTPVDLSGYILQDLDLPVPDTASGEIPAGTILQPGGVLVLAGRSLSEWEQGWGPVSGYQYIQLPSFGDRANNADLVNEVLTLLGPDTNPDPAITARIRADVANYSGTTSNGEPQNGWPGNDGRSAIYLRPTGSAADLNVDRNNLAGSWALHFATLDGARTANFVGTGTVFNGRDVGSPGFVPTGVPQRPVGGVIISEVMYATNSDFPGQGGPLGPPGVDEWVEIVNVSGQPVDVSGWFLSDEDGSTAGIPAGTILQPAEAIVIIGDDERNANPTPISSFYDAWGCGYRVVAVTGWYNDTIRDGINRLGDGGEVGSASSPTLGREILTLRRADNTISDIVNYDDDGFIWPLVANGQLANPAFSIFVFDSADYTELANDDGLSWGTSFPNFRGGRENIRNTVINGRQFGSPGFVFALTAPLDLNNCISSDPCRADFTGDGVANIFDIFAFFNLFGAGDAATDLDGDGDQDIFDIFSFFNVFAAC